MLGAVDFDKFLTGSFDGVGFIADATTPRAVVLSADFLSLALRLAGSVPFFTAVLCPLTGLAIFSEATPLVVAPFFPCNLLEAGLLLAAIRLAVLFLATFDALATATSRSSFLMEPNPATPSRFASFAKSAFVCVFRSAVVIN